MSQREGTASTSGAVDNVSARRNGRPLVSAPAPAPDPEVVAKPTRRGFTAEYKLRILREAERLREPGRLAPCCGARDCTRPT
jgi:hypothetical protein